jgi:ligand-binding sensor domain-containing protein
MTVGDSLWFMLPYKSSPELTLTHLARLRYGEVTEFPLTTSDACALEFDRDGNLWLGDFKTGLLRIDSNTLAKADPHDFHVETIAPDQTRVRDLFTDRDGNLWICSDKGLWRLKGTPPVRVFTDADGLPSQNIYSVLEDKQGRIWFGAWENNLVYYEGGKFYTEHFDLVTALFEDRQFRLWVGNHRAWYRNGSDWIPTERHWAPVTKLVNGEVDVISQDRDGNIWYGGAETGISRFDGTNVRKFTTGDGIPGVSVTSFLQTRG